MTEQDDRQISTSEKKEKKGEKLTGLFVRLTQTVIKLNTVICNES